MHFIIVLPPWFLWVFLVSQLNDIPITEALLFHFPILDTCDITGNMNVSSYFYKT